MNLLDAQGRAVQLGETIGHGGEATVYGVKGQESCLAKIYDPEPRPNYALKLAWMVEHPPENPTVALHHPSLAWPGWAFGQFPAPAEGLLYGTHPQCCAALAGVQSTPEK